MAASKLQANWLAVAHGSTTITRVSAVTFSQGGSLAEYSGDGDHFPTLIVNLMNKPTCSITSADIAVLMGIAPGTTATIAATHKDAAAATGGNIVYALINAVAENASANGPHNQFGSATGTFKSYSSDGSTNPLSFTRT